MTRSEQFALLEVAETNLLLWATQQGIPLHRIEFVVPFVDSDISLSAWFFFETDEQLSRSVAMQWDKQLSAEFIEQVGKLGYAAEWLKQICFIFDSHENVVRNYEGSYFFRLR